MPNTESPVTAARKTHEGIAIALGLAPWLCAYVGAYTLHSALAAFVLYHALCLLAGAAHRRIRGPRAHSPLIRAHWLGLAAACLLVCAGTYFGAGLMGAFIEPSRVTHGMYALHIDAGPISIAALYLYFALVNPVAEEMFWRGSVYTELRQAKWSVHNAALVSALLFGSWHWLILRLFFSAGWAVVLTGGIIAIGYLFARLYEGLKSLPALIVIHALGADIPILIALWVAVLAKG